MSWLWPWRPLLPRRRGRTRLRQLRYAARDRLTLGFFLAITVLVGALARFGL